ncbi:hypothetical protein C0991_006813 [Blastosporella zonata]|nr:hypothetical protein C0991_006813 [Blastosporella zonata]
MPRTDRSQEDADSRRNLSALATNASTAGSSAAVSSVLSVPETSGQRRVDSISSVAPPGVKIRGHSEVAISHIHASARVEDKMTSRSSSKPTLQGAGSDTSLVGIQKIDVTPSSPQIENVQPKATQTRLKEPIRSANPPSTAHSEILPKANFQSTSASQTEKIEPKATQARPIRTSHSEIPRKVNLQSASCAPQTENVEPKATQTLPKEPIRSTNPPRTAHSQIPEKSGMSSGSETEGKGGNQSPRPGAGSNSEPTSYLTALAAHKRLADTDSDSIKKGPSWMPSLGFSKLFNKSGKPPVTTPLRAEVTDKDIVVAVMGRFIDDLFGDGFERQDVSSPHTHFIVAQDPSDSSRKLFLVYSTGSKEQKLNDAIRYVLGWLSDSCGDKLRKFSGLIYLEDSSTSAPSKLSRNALDLLDKCVDRPNIVVATTGWDDDIEMEPLEARHKELIEQWRAFVERGVSVLRLSVPGKTSRDVSHTSWDVVKLIITKSEEKASATKRSVWKAKEKKAEDKFLEDPRDTDIVIPIMGPTGAGKSTFINFVTGQSVAVVGHNLKSETAQLQHVILPHPTDHTPGVIYLHEISQTRMLGTARKNLDMFNKLIGKDATKNVVLATTKWGDIPEDVGARREEQLGERHWKWMVDLGAKLLRFTDSQESGWNIIQHILDQAATQEIVDTVEIQQELVEVKKILPETEAGQALLYTLEELLENQRLAAAQLRKDETSDQVKDIMRETDQKIRETLRQINDLSGNRLRFWKRR